MTPLLVQLLARELKGTLLSAKVSHISQSAPEVVEMSFYHPDRSLKHLSIALLPQKPLMFLSTHKPQALAKPPNLCRSLRKNLEFAQLAFVAHKPGERILSLHLKTPEGIFQLVFEGIPKYPNLILIGPDGNIVSALRYKNEVERPVMPQQTYDPPPQGPTLKPNLWDLSGHELESLWDQGGRPPLGPWLKEHFHGTDSELAGYLETQGESAFGTWDRLKTDLEKGPIGPFFLFPGPPPTLRVLPFGPSTVQPQPFAHLSQALEELYILEKDHHLRVAGRAKLESEVARALKHEKRTQEKLKKDRAEAEKADQYQWWGELLMASLHKLKPHQKEVTLEDVVRGNPKPLVVPLDPGVTPLQNAQRYFKKSQKGSRGLALVEKRENEVKARIEQLRAAQRSFPALRTAEEIKKATLDLFPKKKDGPAKAAKPKEEKVPTPNILREKLGKEFELCAGTSAAANEYVTFQLAQPEDLWFHVRDLPGAHVVLRKLKRGIEAPPELILKAAQLAASRSKAKAGAKVTVSYTEKKNVRKIPGAPTGMVTMTKEKSLLVEVV